MNGDNDDEMAEAEGVFMLCFCIRLCCGSPVVVTRYTTSMKTVDNARLDALTAVWRQQVQLH